MFELLDVAARDVIMGAQARALAMGHHEIRPGHLLLGVLDDGAGLAYRVLHGLGAGSDDLTEAVASGGPADPDLLRGLGIDPEAVRRHAEAAFGAGALAARRRWSARERRRVRRKTPFAAGTQAALKRAQQRATALGHDYIGTAHLLLGLLDDPAVADSLARCGVDTATVDAEVDRALRGAA